MKKFITYLLVSQFNIQTMLRFFIVQFISLLGYKVYVFRSAITIQNFLRKIQIHHTDTEDDSPSGYFIGDGLVGWTNYSNFINGVTLILVCHVSTYKLISEKMKTSNVAGLALQDSNRIVSIDPSVIHFTFMYSDSNRIFTKKRMSKLKPTANQLAIIDKIIQIYYSKGSACVYIHGEPGVGKSTVATLVTQYLGGCIVTNTFSPLQAGKPDFMSHHTTLIDDQCMSSMIICMDEVDQIIEKLMKGLNDLAFQGKRCFESKVDWNSLFDDIQKGYYEKTIVIMTSNKPPTFFNETDPSLLRIGRIDEYFHLIKA